VTKTQGVKETTTEKRELLPSGEDVTNPTGLKGSPGEGKEQNTNSLAKYNSKRGGDGFIRKKKYET